MKLRKIEKYKNKLIKLQIIKLHYKKQSVNFKSNLKQVEVFLNKVSNIIYRYHVTNRKILFLGFPDNFKKVIKDTKHLLVPEFLWFNGMLSNRVTDKTNLSLNTFKLITQLKKKVDLIVVCNLTEQTTAIEESYIARIPVISISRNLNILNLKTTYKSIGNYNIINEKMENNNLFFSFINTTLNRAKKTKQVNIYKNLKTLKTIIERNKLIKDLRTFAKSNYILYFKWYK